MQTEIRRGQEADRRGIAETLVEAFYKEYKAISKSKPQLVEIMERNILPERFIVAFDKDSASVVGALSLSDEKGYAVGVDEAQLKRMFGWFKGKIVAGILRDEFIRPLHFATKTAYIANVAVRENARGQGIAKALLRKALRMDEYETYTLDVVEGNEVVLPLYKGLGFVEVGREKEKGGWMKGFRFRYLLTHKRV